MAILLICALLIPSAYACIGGGSGGCCMPTQSCAPSLPPCPTPSYPQMAPVAAPQSMAQPCTAISGCGAGGSYAAPAAAGYAAPASGYAAPVASYSLSSSGGYAAPPISSGYAASFPRPLSGTLSGNAAPVVRKVITVQKALPESKLTVQEAEKPETIDIVEPQPPSTAGEKGSLSSVDSRLSATEESESIVEEPQEPYAAAATREVVRVQPESETPSPVPIVVLPISTITPVPAAQEATAGAENPPAPAVKTVPSSSEYQASIDSAYEEIASEEEALKRQENDYGKGDKETDTVMNAQTILPAVQETYATPEASQPELLEPESAAVPHEGNEEYSATSKEPERPATLIESYQGYYQEPTVAPLPPGPEQPLTGMEQEQRVDVPSSSQSGEYVEDTSIPEEQNMESDAGACNNEELRGIVENALRSQSDNLEAARQIEGDASKKFGGRFNAIVSDAEFAYVNWYGKMNCQLRVGNRHSLTWED